MNKAFTLIELLVVVAIIGILAAVGVVAYNGYTNAAKRSATKANHKQVVQMVSAELLKCAQEGKITLNKWDGQTFSTVTVNCFTIHHQSLRDHFNRHFEAQQFRNPYYPNNNAVQNKGGLCMSYEKFVMDVDQAGMMRVSAEGVDMKIRRIHGQRLH